MEGQGKFSFRSKLVSSFMIYTFLNNNTGEVEEHTMRMSELDQFKLDNPHLVRYFTPDSMPALGDATRMSVPGVGQPHAAFERGVIQRIKETVPGNTLAGHKTKMPREW
jgi:hypothetical protein